MKKFSGRGRRGAIRFGMARGGVECCQCGNVASANVASFQFRGGGASGGRALPFRLRQARCEAMAWPRKRFS